MIWLLAGIVVAVVLWLVLPLVAGIGRLLDKNGQPVAEAWVVAHRINFVGFAHSSSYCAEVKVAKTFEGGVYVLPMGFLSLFGYSLTGYREGYVPGYRNAARGVERFMEKDGRDPRFASMDPITGRIAYLSKEAREMSCFSAPVSQKSALIPVFKDMFKEASAAAQNSEQRRLARQICREMYWTQMTGSNPTLLPDEDEREQERFLSGVEPACNEPVDDSERDERIVKAILKGNLAAVRAAAKAGYDFNRLRIGGSPPVVTSALQGSGELVAELVTAGTNPDAPGADGRTALELVVATGHVEPSRRGTFRMLLDAGADPNKALLRIAEGDVPADVEAFELLLNHGARIDYVQSCRACAGRGQSVLHGVRDPNMARIAIKHGADVNARDDYRATPLMFVRTPEIASVLLENGADPNICNMGGETPLMWALSGYEMARDSDYGQQHREIALVLVKAGARLDGRTKHGTVAISFTKDEALKDRLRALAADR